MPDEDNYILCGLNIIEEFCSQAHEAVQSFGRRNFDNESQVCMQWEIIGILIIGFTLV